MRSSTVRFSARGDEDDRLGDLLGRGDGGRDRHPRRVRQHAVGERHDVGGMVAEKNSVCRLTGMAATMRRTSWMKPMSSMRSASSSTRCVTPSRRTWPWFIRSSRRPGGGDEHVGRAAQRNLLPVLAHAAVDDGVARADVVTVDRDALGNLRRELARRGDDQDADLARAGRGGEHLEDRQDERRRLAGAGGGAGEHVAPGQGVRDDLHLHGGRAV